MKILLAVFLTLFALQGCSSNNLAPTTPHGKPKKSVAKKVTKTHTGSKNDDLNATMRMLEKNIASDMKRLNNLKKSSRVFSGRQSSLGASFSRNLVSAWGGNPYKSRVQDIQRSLDYNLSMYKALQNIHKKKRLYRCDDLTTRQAFSLLRSGHTYLDRDNDGIPCE